ncbi:phage minor head protein [Nocardioides sp. T2.26MG-1]|uniref:phage minor head protein n=1 Tax=Nocardioides sp. T2.26MG-1 TaxID=3041166 RepID=UPI002477599A|nr:phage minor head protein [Nocardioides sp. T2.26MG-1]CAI9417328.1 hypothetical protein HIDPHFAB_02992 [Nocardioides sp. T2.26MG-1]
MSVTDRTLRLQRRIERDLRKITDRQTRTLVAAWADAWDEVAPDLTATLLDMLTAGDKITRAQLLRSERLRKALTVIADRLDTLAADAGVLIIGDLRTVIDQAGGAQASVIDSQLPPRSGLLDGLDTWSRVDERQIAAIVARSTKRITARTRPLSRTAYTAVRRELLRGVAAGSSPRVTARRIVARVDAAGERFNGGLNRALTIARTETLDAHREGARIARTQHADVLTGWRWVTHLDTNTCPACVGMAGTIHPVEEPGPLGHPNCRCTAVPVPKPWRDLGFTDITEPAGIYPDPQLWFDRLTVEEQRGILGPARLEAYQMGDFPMSAWAVRRSNPGWRDSYQPAPAPHSGGRVSRTAA